jgi:hypothetical protein
MATQPQLAANIVNAQLSTGPRTAEGRQTIARNAVRHGMFTCLDRLHPADQALVEVAYDTFRATYPQPDAELWVRELALAWFRRDRARALAAPLYSCDDDDSLRALDRFHRWERHFTRDIDKMLKLLNSIPQTPECEIDKTNPIPAPATAPQSLNSPCRCGSGLKFKRCCGATARNARHDRMSLAG